MCFHQLCQWQNSQRNYFSKERSELCGLSAHCIFNIVVFCNPYLTRQVKWGHFPLQCNGLLGVEGRYICTERPTEPHVHIQPHAHKRSIHTVICPVQWQPHIPDDKWYICTLICCNLNLTLSGFFQDTRHDCYWHTDTKREALIMGIGRKILPRFYLLFFQRYTKVQYLWEKRWSSSIYKIHWVVCILFFLWLSI